MKEIDEITHDAIGIAMRIHNDLGPGLLESVYEAILTAKLLEMGYKVDRQKPIDIHYEAMHFPAAFRIDILVEDRIDHRGEVRRSAQQGSCKTTADVSPIDRRLSRLDPQFQ